MKSSIPSKRQRLDDSNLDSDFQSDGDESGNDDYSSDIDEKMIFNDDSEDDDIPLSSR